MKIDRRTQLPTGVDIQLLSTLDKPSTDSQNASALAEPRPASEIAGFSLTCSGIYYHW
jgi:hypothetical protein